jgi:hypothetical protein
MMQTRWEIVRDLKNAFGSLKRVWEFKNALGVKTHLEFKNAFGSLKTRLEV